MQDLGAEGGARDVEQVVAELGRVLAIVGRAVLEGLACDVGGLAPTGDDRLRMDLLRYELLGFLMKVKNTNN